uniref:Uncharacterized protein n=1 Tax=Amphora coffeiformis TaxID=265554 RepID=A0A7S3KZH1_9STRA|mmetsp:Transcript_14136/g.28497  ORF Transcript_14136/g.28497 Transcript_14136/m.28497 type:complete len:666 (+) Transcript_14136:80-2077(+)
MASVCPSSEVQEPVSAYRPAPFSTAGSVDSVHKLAPRFGRTSNITGIIVTEGQEQNDLAEDYLRGILATAIIIFVVILTWMIALLILKCCGKRRVGVFSGQPVTLTWKQSSKQVPQEETHGEDVSETRNEQEDIYGEGTSETEATPRITNTKLKDMSTDRGDPEEDLRIVSSQDQDKGRAIRMRRLRITALCAGVGVFVGSILMVTKGLNHLQNSIDDSRTGLMDGRRLALEAASLIEFYKTTEKSVVSDINSIIPQLNTFCPNIRERICQVTQSGKLTESCDYTDIPFGDILEALDLPNVDANVVFDEATAVLDGQGFDGEDLPDDTDSLPDNLPGNIPQSIQGGVPAVGQPGSRALQNSDSLDGIQNDLEEIADDMLDYDQKVDEFEWPFRVAKAFALVVAILDIFVIICLVQAWIHDASVVPTQTSENSQSSQKWIFRILKTWVLLPLFILVVILSWILSMVFAIGSITTSDLCYESPDPRLLAFVETQDNWKTTLVYDFITYYLNSCPADKEPFALEEVVVGVNSVVGTLDGFLGQVKDSAATVEAICGSDPGSTVSLADTLVDQMCSVTLIIQRVQRFLACDNWYPLYSLVAHDAVCANAAQGFLWLGATQFLIVVCAMVLLTTRASLYETKYEDNSEMPIESRTSRDREYGSSSDKQYS